MIQQGKLARRMEKANRKEKDEKRKRRSKALTIVIEPPTKTASFVTPPIDALNVNGDTPPAEPFHARNQRKSTSLREILSPSSSRRSNTYSSPNKSNANFLKQRDSVQSSVSFTQSSAGGSSSMKRASSSSFRKKDLQMRISRENPSAFIWNPAFPPEAASGSNASLKDAPRSGMGRG